MSYKRILNSEPPAWSKTNVREPTTYHELAKIDSDGLGGRFKTKEVINVAPQWSKDAAALPPERPLGYDINEVPNIEACSWEGDAQGPDGQAERQERVAAALKAIPHEAEAQASDAPTIQQGQTAQRLRVRGLVQLAQAVPNNIPIPAAGPSAGPQGSPPLRRR
jgi:hypothetical protein